MARHPDDFRPIAEALSLLERIAEALEELVELERTEPLETIIHPSNTRETFPQPDNDECDMCGGTGGRQGVDNMDIDECPECDGTGKKNQ